MLKERVTVADSTPHRNPFEGHIPGEWPAPTGSIGLKLAPATLASVTLISTWPTGFAALQEALAAALQANVPAATGQTASAARGLLMRTGPEEFLLLSDQSADMTRQLRQSIAADIGSVTDLSHARCSIGLQGAHCRITLSKLFALDLRASQFPIGEIRLTGHHHVPCLLHRTGEDDFTLVAFTSYAHDQLATLMDAGREFGVRLEPTRISAG
jgi:heterotetrameric sarcosine oxidase gamma subunit